MAANVQCYLRELDRQRDKLANILVEKGIEADESETYNSLVEKVNQLGAGGSVPNAGNAVIMLDNTLTGYLVNATEAE